MKAVQSIEGRGFIALGEGRIIKDGVHEVSDFAFEQKDGLADVQQLGGVFAEDMYAEQLERFAVKQELQSAFGMSADLAARNLAVIGHTYFIGNVGLGELLLGLADK